MILWISDLNKLQSALQMVSDTFTHSAALSWVITRTFKKTKQKKTAIKIPDWQTKQSPWRPCSLSREAATQPDLSTLISLEAHRVMKEDREGLQSCTHTSKPHMPIPPKPHAHTLLKQQSTPPIALSLMAAGTDCPQWASTRGLLWTHAILSSLLCVFVWLLLFTRPWLRRRPAGAQTGSQIISFCSDPNTQSVTSRPTLTETLLLQLKKQKQHTCMQRKGGQACERVSCPGMPQLFGQIDSNCVFSSSLLKYSCCELKDGDVETHPEHGRMTRWRPAEP